jgi:enolase
MDAAATHFFDANTGSYNYLEKKLSRVQLLDLYEGLTKTYPLRSIEDPFNEDDFDGFTEITRRCQFKLWETICLLQI